MGKVSENNWQHICVNRQIIFYFHVAGVRQTLQSGDFYTVCDPQRLFLTVHDAVLAAQRNLVADGENSAEKSGEDCNSKPIQDEKQVSK